MNRNEYHKHYSGRKQVTQRKQTLPDTSNEQFLANLSSAIRHDELLLHYQPRYDLLTGHANYLEALVRWERPGLGTFYPNMFLQAAEQHGLIFGLDLWVFEQCCRDLNWLRDNISSRLKMAVNVSSLDCESVYYSQKLIDLCENHHLSLSDFEFEISEAHIINDMRKITAFCKTLSSYGARFCLDGFGTGFGSLSRLQELPVNCIKIDQSFIAGIGESRHSEIIIKNLHQLARDLNLTTIACGVEHKYQYEFLSDLGCEQMQGFYFYSPGKIGRMKKAKLFIADEKKF